MRRDASRRVVHSGRTEDTERAQRFIRLYNELDRHLRGLAKVQRELAFSSLLSDAAGRDAAVKTFERDLREFAELRNAIVHDRAYPAQIIAEPTPEALFRFEQIVEQVCRPPSLLSLAHKNVRCFAPSDKLSDALTHMREHGYSQVVVKTEGGLALLTTEGIATWLQRRCKDDIISLAEATVGDALTNDLVDALKLLPRSATVFDARDAFCSVAESGLPRLYAIIITENGRRAERPLGIVTPWDILN